jgi:hypothetical protein
MATRDGITPVRVQDRLDVFGRPTGAVGEAAGRPDLEPGPPPATAIAPGTPVDNTELAIPEVREGDLVPGVAAGASSAGRARSGQRGGDQLSARGYPRGGCRNLSRKSTCH